jgi:cobalt-zinc-cadmium resistance protein CzcA
MPFSIAAGVGFVALFGVAVLNGLVWVSRRRARAGRACRRGEQRLSTAEVRIRPVLMTAPRREPRIPPDGAGHRAGAEIQRPLATVVIGGILTSTLLTALADPAIYPWFVPRFEPASSPDVAGGGHAG